MSKQSPYCYESVPLSVRLFNVIEPFLNEQRLFFHFSKRVYYKLTSDRDLYKVYTNKKKKTLRLIEDIENGAPSASREIPPQHSNLHLLH